MKVEKGILFIFGLSLVAANVSSQVKTITANITGCDSSFSVHIGGSVDAQTTRRYREETVFVYGNSIPEKNLSLTIANNSPTTIVNPEIRINNKGIKYTFRDWVREIPLDGLGTIDDTLKAVWSFITQNYYHWPVSSIGSNGKIKPLQSFNTFGSGLCENVSQVYSSLVSFLGYRDVYTIGTPYHATGEMHYPGRGEIPFDADIKVFYTDRSNSALATTAQLMQDQDLVRRQHHYGYLYNSVQMDNDVSYIYSPQIKRYKNYLDAQDSMLLIIRPGEEITFGFSNPATAYYSYFSLINPRANYSPPPTASLGSQRYVPALDSSFQKQLSWCDNIAFSHGGIHNVSSSPASFELAMTNPFVITNADVVFRFSKKNNLSKLKIYFRKEDAAEYSLVFSSFSAPQSGRADSVNLYSLIAPTSTPMTQKYYVKFELIPEGSDTLWIDSLRCTSYFQFNPNAIPGFNTGQNTVHISSNDGSSLSGLTFSHSYRELPNLYSKPPAVQDPIYPMNNQVVLSSKFAFRWEKPDAVSENDIRTYHLQVSEREDFRYPVSSTFTVMTGTVATWEIPSNGLLNPQTPYYWRIATLNSQGVWSDWSPTWKFSIQAPGVPTHPLIVEAGDSIALKWEANPDGTLPVRYLILGSNEKGFSFDPSCIIDSTVNTNYAIKNSSRLLKYAYYRVIAVDQNGTRSDISDQFIMDKWRLLFNKPEHAFLQVGQNVTIPIAKIEPIEKSSRGLYVPPLVQKDSLQLRFSHPTERITDSTVSYVVTDENDSIFTIETTTSVSLKKYRTAFSNQINKSPHLSSLKDTVALKNRPLNISVKPVDQDDDSAWFNVFSKPNWLNINAQNGTFSGYPPEAGRYSIRLRLNDSRGAQKDTIVTIAVKENSPPIIKAFPRLETKEDSVYSSRLLAVDPDSSFGDSVHFKWIVRPSWMWMNGRTGELGGTPRSIHVGDTTLVIQMDDWKGGVIQQNIKLRIRHTNHPPFIVKSPPQVAFIDSQYTGRILSADPDSMFGDTVHYYWVTRPSWMWMNGKTGELGGIPRVKHLGDTIMTVRLEDWKGGITVKVFNLKIARKNTPPFVTKLPATFAKEDANYLSKIIAIDKDSLYGDTVHYYWVTRPSWMWMNGKTGEIGGTPRSKHVGDTVMVIKMDDWKGGVTYQSVALRILPRNDVVPSMSDDVNIQSQDIDIVDRNEQRISIPFSWIKECADAAITAEHDGMTDDVGSRVLQNGRYVFNATVFRQKVSTGEKGSQKSGLHIWKGEGFTYINDSISVIVDPGQLERADTICSVTVPVDDSLHYIYHIVVDTRVQKHVNEVSGLMTSKVSSSSVISEHRVYQNFPNPFNPSTMIKIDAAYDDYVHISVYDILGREVRILWDGMMTQGEHHIPFNASHLPNGMYYYYFSSAHTSIMYKMLLLK